MSEVGRKVAVPVCCYACESRTVERHCQSPRCIWVRCKKCMAVSAHRKGRRFFGGVERIG